MALVTCDFFSDVLEVGCSMTVVLPQPTEEQIGVSEGPVPRTDFPVLYLLHGLSDDDTIWLRRTSIERYVAPLGLAVVMPQVHRSFYTDEAYGGRYWTFISEELPEPDCPPVRLKLLGERMVAFRDSKGKLGLIDEFCAHRGVSLWFGRNEECGLRCPYHGWKYDVTGQCVEIPSEPDNPRLCQRMKHKGYPLIERGGVLWT